MVAKCLVMRFSLPNLMTLALLGSLLTVALVKAAPKRDKIHDEEEAEEFMKELDAKFSHECNLEMKARWEYIVDVTDPDKEDAANEAAVRYLNFKGEAAVNSSQFDYSDFKSIELYRRFRFLSKQGPGALDADDLNEYKAHQSKMETIYSTATICDYYDPSKCDLTLEPDIEFIMANSENFDELRYVWDQWREVSGKLMREDFIRFVELSNKAATLDGFTDTSMFWLNGYTVDDREASSFTAADPLSQDQFKQMVDDVWQKVSTDLYKKLHSWVRWKLSEVYPDHIDLKGPMPANVLGNMWAQDWVNVADHVMPFPEFPSYDVSESMVKNGWNIDQMFHSAQDFFESVGLFPMTQIFWDKSVINQTAWGKVMLCHASAEDFCLGPDGDDYRIKMCTEVNMEDLVTVHHEMGHIEYFMAYKNLPHVFRDSANPGFHEAIGDLIALSVSTPSHLENVLHLSPGEVIVAAPSATPKYSDDEKRDLNFLMRMALEKISFLPFGYLIDKFRWGVFDGSIPTEEMNEGWWQLRENLQGITPPGEARGEEFFDAGAKYHVPANVPYIRYFVSFIVQFQFHAHLCDVAGHTGPLHTCDIYNNTKAGSVLKGALEKGFSEPWPIILQDLGGSLDMDPSAIISYFDPLIKFLDEELANAGQCIGWGDECMPLNVEAVLPIDDSKPVESAESSVAPTTAPPVSSTGPSTAFPGSSTEPSTAFPGSSTEPSTAFPGSSTEPSTAFPGSSTEPSTAFPGSSTEPSTAFPGSSTEPPTVSPTTEPTTTIDPSSEDEAKQEMEIMDEEMTMLSSEIALSSWNYQTSLEKIERDNMTIAWLNKEKSFRVNHQSVISYFNYTFFESEDLQRQFDLQKNPGASALTDEELQEFTDVMNALEQEYEKKKVCPADKVNCQEDEKLDIYEVEQRMADPTTKYDDLAYYWNKWRETNGQNMLTNYKKYITKENDIASKNGFSHIGLLWMDPYLDEYYNSTEFLRDIDLLWNQTKPLYEKLHAYVREKLKEVYGQQAKTFDDLIGAHTVGDMWAMNWENIYDLVAPYKDVSLPDVTEGLDYYYEDAKDMTNLVEEFFRGIGLFNMTPQFWNHSMITERSGEMVCQPSAFDFYDIYSEDLDPQTDGDFRIKMCAEKTQADFLTLHHQMGHVQYMMAYSKRSGNDTEYPSEFNESMIMPLIFRQGATPAFHEAISDTIGLSVSSPPYLQMISDLLNVTEPTTIGPFTTGPTATGSGTTEHITTAATSDQTASTEPQTSAATSDKPATTEPQTSAATSDKPATTEPQTSAATSAQSTSDTTKEKTADSTGDLDPPSLDSDVIPDLEYNITINFLMKTALSKIALLSHAYVMHSWQMQIMEDNNAHKDFNKRWWTLRIAEQGLAPPSKRLPESEFDAGASYYSSVPSPFIWRFVATILEFQFHRKLCDVAGISPPYHMCSINGSQEAGKALLDLMASGMSKPWQMVLDDFLGERNDTFGVDAILDYFEPLDEYLTQYLNDSGIPIGWNPDQIDDYMGVEREEISPVVPIIVGVVLACMVCIVIIAYFVGQHKQKKKNKALEAQQQSSTGMSNLGMEEDEDTQKGGEAHGNTGEAEEKL